MKPQATQRILPPRITLNRSQILELLVLVGLFVLLLLYLLLRSAGNFSYKLPRFDAVAGSDIQAIRWSRSNGSELILRKNGDQWYIGEQQYPARQSYVDTLLKQLSQPSLQDLVSRSSQDGGLLPFGLDNERVYKLEAFGAEQDSLRQLYVGKSSSSGRYSFVRLSEDAAQIFSLSENLTAVLEKSIDELRDRLVLSFDSSEIEKLQISNTNNRTIAAEKKEDKWQLLQTPPISEVSEEVRERDEEQIQRLVNRFASMNAQSFLADYPQTESEYELKFIAKGGVSYTITIAAEKLGGADEGYAAKSSSYGFPFTLNSYTVESMLKDFGFIDELGE